MTLHSWFRRRAWEQKMDRELRFHLDSRIEDLMAQGLSREEATRRARIDFGSLDVTREECRDERPAEWLHHFSRDIRYAGRNLLRAPAFAFAAILTLALGIGANTAIFSAVYMTLLHPLPYRDANRIYSVEVVIPERVSQFPSLPVTIQAFLEWRRTASGFDGMTALRPWECNISGDGEPERLGGAHVAANFFDFLGSSIVRGRGFAPNEEQPGNERVVVISHALWQRRYAGDPSVIGRKLDINGDPHTIVGIASPNLLVPVQTQLHHLLPFAPRVDVWKPIAPTARELQNESWDHGVLIRLRPGQDAYRANEQLQSLLVASMEEKQPGIEVNFRTRLTPIREVYSGSIRVRLLLVLAASGLLLLTACANVANLLLARAASRAAEFATRIALGAGRWRILSQTTAETTILTACGGALGMLIAFVGAKQLNAIGPLEVRELSGIHPIALLFTLAVSILTAIACGTIPAWNLYRQDAVTSLRESARSALSSGIRTRQTLVGVQIALGTILLFSTGLLLRSFVNVTGADHGYFVEHVTAVDLSLFGRAQNPSAFYPQLAENVRMLGGVQAAGIINDLPATAGQTGASRTIFYPTDTDFQSVVLKRPVAMIRSITSGYFAASGTALRAGRYLGDQEPAPVALISESLARTLWPAAPVETAVGRSIRQGNVTGPLITVVGVVQDVRAGSADRELPPFLYRPYRQWASGPATLVVRSALAPAHLAPALRAEIRKLAPNLPIPAIRSMREIVSEAVVQRRFQLLLTGVFAVTALVLSAIGVFGVVSYAVACRRREIGLRMAVGATRETVAGWILLSGMRPVLAGIVVGICGAIAAAFLARGLLYHVTPFDPYSLAAVVGLMLLSAVVACYLPARRAASLDPMAALRCE